MRIPKASSPLTLPDLLPKLFARIKYFSYFVLALKQRVDAVRKTSTIEMSHERALGSGSTQYRKAAGEKLYDLASRIPMSKPQVRAVLAASTPSELAQSLSRPLERWEQRVRKERRGVSPRRGSGQHKDAAA